MKGATILKLTSAVCGVASLFCMSSCNRDNDDPPAVITILSPSDLDTINVSSVNVVVSTTNFELGADEFSLFYQLNDEDETVVNELAFEVSGLTPGTNTIHVGLKHDENVLSADEISLYFADDRGDSVVVVNGTGSDRYLPGSTVVIEALAKDVPYIFDYWTGDTEFLADSTLSPLFFTMPAQPVRLEAVYKVDSSYFHSLQVTYGTGGGKYLPGETVQVNVLMEAPLVFTHWSGGSDFLADDSLSVELIFEMPDRDVALAGKWQVLNVSFSDHLYPIIELRCNDAGCHGENGAPSYQTYEALAADAQNLVNKTQSGNMPPPLYGQLSDEELEIIRVWVEEGNQDN